MSKPRTLAAALALALPLVAHGQATYEPARWYDDRWYVTPFGSYILSDSERMSGDGWGGGLAIGRPIHPNWNLELRGMYEELSAESNGPGKYKNWSATIDAHWYFLGRAGLRHWTRDAVQPYAIIGVGAINDDVPAGNKTSFMGNAGLGILWPFSNWGRLVGDVRYRWDDNRGNFGEGGSFGDWIFSAGLQIPLGVPPRVAEAPRAAPPPAPVPPPVVVPAPVVKPAPPPPKPVVRNFELSADGMFEFDKSNLTAVGRSRVDNLIKGLREAGITLTSMTIAGHTDPLGTPDYNQRLSLDRANTVRDYMVSQGVPAGVIRTEGRGESQLLVTEADCKAKGQAKTQSALIACLLPNRRVVIQATGEQRG